MALAAACGSDDEGDGGSAQPGPDAGSDSAAADSGAVDAGPEDSGFADTATQQEAAATGVTATVTVPDGFAATPVKLAAYFYSSVPPMGPPQGMGDSVLNPNIGPGTPLELETHSAGLEGDYYLEIVLFVEGGGAMMPEEGVDYMGQSAGPLTLGSGPVNAGNIELSLY